MNLVRTYLTLVKTLCLSAFALIFTFGLSAEENDCEFEECSFRSWGVSLDLLRWKPCIDGLTYGARESESTPGCYSIQEVKPEAEYGLRIGMQIGKLFADRDLLISYTHHKSDETINLKSDADFIPINVSPIDSRYIYINTDWVLRYDELKALLGYDLLSNECYHVKTLFGVSGILLKERLEAYFCGHSPYMVPKWKQHTSGIGATAGLVTTYRLSENFDCKISGLGSLLSTKAKAYDDVDARGITRIKGKTSCRMIHGYEIEALLRYETCLFSQDLLFHIGYQLLQWHNIPNDRFTMLYGEDDALSPHQTGSSKTIGFHGFIFGLNMAL